MIAAQSAMEKIYMAKYCALHVRLTNRGAFGLYKDVLQYEIRSTEKGYYADGEDAYDMVKYFDLEFKAKKEREAREKDDQPDEEKKTEEEPENVDNYAGAGAAYNIGIKPETTDKKKKKRNRNKKKNKGGAAEQEVEDKKEN